MKDPAFNCLALGIAGGIARIHLNRPELHNRFDEALHREFPAALQEIAASRDIAALLISAQGRSFSAGGDLDMMRRANSSAELRTRLADEARAIVDGLLGLECPIIAAVQGNAIGLGASVIGCCDIVVAWREARIADPHVLLGLVAGDGGIMAWSQSVGIMRAKRYLLTGEPLSAEQAYAMGLVTDLAATPEAALEAAETIAKKFLALPRGGVRGTKRAFSRLSSELYGATFGFSLAEEMKTLAGEELLAALDATQVRERAR